MSKPNSVVVHPLVLLSVVDHYNRVAADTNKRVVGILLGATIQGKTDITNSYAVPFEEDDKDPSIWFLDHNYHENMYAMFKKVNAREKVVGWYSTGPKIRANDIDIHQLMQKFTPNPVYVIVDVKPKDVGIPTDSYIAVEEIQDEKSEPKLTFAHIPSEIGALEAEEVGVEHLLRDIKDTTVSDLQSSVAARLSSLSALKTRLGSILTYLENVVDGKLPINHSILYLLQDIFNLLPGLQESEIQEAFRTQTNDTMLTIYVSSVVRTIIALHNLVNNKKDLKEAEQEREEKAKQKKKEKREKERAEREKLEIKEKAEKEKAEGKKKQQEH